MTTSTLPRTKRGPKRLTNSAPRVVIYCRISRDRIGKHLGTDRQEKECREVLAAEIPDGEIVAVLTDNDKSGYSGKSREGYETLADMIRRGEVDVLVAWHMDRLTRRVIELAALIELCQRHGVTIRTKIAGAFDPNNPSAVMAAQIMGTVAEYESAIKSERVKSKHRELAAAGQMPGGRRRFGYTSAMEIVEGEAAIVREIAGRILHGESMASLARDLNTRGVMGASGSGVPWSSQSLRSMIVRPHLAGLRAHRGEITAVGQWAPILDVPTFEAMVGKLTDKTRRSPSSTASKWLLTNLARCGVCGGPMRVQGGNRARSKVYFCNNAGHVARVADGLETAVTEWVVKRLTLVDVRGALADDTDSQELANLTDRLAELEALEVTLSDRWAAGEIDGARYDRDLAALAKRRTNLDATIGALTEQVAAPVRALDGVTGPNAREVFAGLPLARRRAIIDALCTIHVDRVTKRGRGAFDPESIRVVPKAA